MVGGLRRTVGGLRRMVGGLRGLIAGRERGKEFGFKLGVFTPALPSSSDLVARCCFFDVT
jgi:hypothetical protein